MLVFFEVYLVLCFVFIWLKVNLNKIKKKRVKFIFVFILVRYIFLLKFLGFYLIFCKKGNKKKLKDEKLKLKSFYY